MKARKRSSTVNASGMQDGTQRQNASSIIGISRSSETILNQGDPKHMAKFQQKIKRARRTPSAPVSYNSPNISNKRDSVFNKKRFNSNPIMKLRRTPSMLVTNKSRTEACSATNTSASSLFEGENFWLVPEGVNPTQRDIIRRKVRFYGGNLSFCLGTNVSEKPRFQSFSSTSAKVITCMSAPVFQTWVQDQVGSYFC